MRAVGTDVVLPGVAGLLGDVARVSRPAAGEGGGVLGGDAVGGEVLRPGVEQPGVQDADPDAGARLRDAARRAQRRDGRVDRVLIPGAQATGEIRDGHQGGVGREIDLGVECRALDEGQGLHRGELVGLGHHGEAVDLRELLLHLADRVELRELATRRLAFEDDVDADLA